MDYGYGLWNLFREVLFPEDKENKNEVIKLIASGNVCCILDIKIGRV